MTASGSTCRAYSSSRRFSSARAVDAAVEDGAALDAEHDVFEHGEILDQHEMLVDHADAGGDRRLAVVDHDRLAVDADLAGIGLIEAVEDRHQRRLAGAVLADDAVDRALLDLEVDGAVGVDRTEALVDADQLDGKWTAPILHGSSPTETPRHSGTGRRAAAAPRTNSCAGYDAGQAESAM